MTKAIIETDQIHKVYQVGEIEVRALNSVSITIKEGEFVAIMGPSGSGKSTMMNILGCLDRPTKGEYTLAGDLVSELDKVQLAGIRNSRIGFVFQSYNLLSRTTALENVLVPLQYDRENARSDLELKAHAEERLEAVGLGNRTEHMPHELSGGQQQRVAIARALINDPVLLLADEPTGNLDSRSGAEIMDMLVELHERGRTIVMVTHEDEIAAFSQRVIRFKDGVIDTDQLNGKAKTQAQGALA